MRGGAPAESGVEVGGHGAAEAGAASGERRPSLVTLQNMLKKASQNEYKDAEFTDDVAAGATDRPQLHLAQSILKTEESQLPPAAQNGVRRNVARRHPFYDYYLESGRKGDTPEDQGTETLEEVFAPPSKFQNSSLDFPSKTETVNNRDRYSEPQRDFTHNPIQDLFQTSTMTQNGSANGHLRHETLNSTNLFGASTPQTQNLPKALWSKDPFKGEGGDLLQTSIGAKGVNPFEKSHSIFMDPFKSSSNQEDDMFQSRKSTGVNPFYTSPANQVDLFPAVPNKSGDIHHVSKNKQDPMAKEKKLLGISAQANLDVFSSSSTSTDDPFPSPITRDLFQDVSTLEDPFGTTPSKQFDPFHNLSNGTPDIFQPLPSETKRRDIPQTAPRRTASQAAFSRPLLSSQSDMKLDTSEDLFRATPSESRPDVRPKSTNSSQDVSFDAPQGTKRSILQPTPFSQAKNLSVSPNPSPSEMTHVQTFRRPPRPLPRTRPPRTEKPPPPEKPPKPERPPTPPTAKPNEPEPPAPIKSLKPVFRPLPKPVVHRKPKTPENKAVDPTNYVVFEDILLIGQERCVEDWPEDSPELNPEFKPSGKFRLRRESLKAKTDSDGGSGEDQDNSGSQIKKKDKKYKMSILSRRGSKDKLPDDTKEEKSRTLPTRKSSKDYFSELPTAAGESEDGVDYKKKPMRTKVNQIFRRASSVSSGSEGKHVQDILPQVSKDDDDGAKKRIGKENSTRRWSAGTVLDNSDGEADARSEEKRKNKLKIKFVPQRGFAITLQKNDDEPKGAYGYTPRKDSKDKSHDEFLWPYGHTPHKNPQVEAYDEIKAMTSPSLQSAEKVEFMADQHSKNTDYFSPGLHVDDAVWGMEDYKPKKASKKNMKLLHMSRRSSKEDMLDSTSAQKKKSSISADELDDEALNWMENSMKKKTKHKGLKSKTTYDTTFGQNQMTELTHYTPQQGSKDALTVGEITGQDFTSPGEMYVSDEDDGETCKPKKPPKLKGLMQYKAKSKAMHPEFEDPSGATSSDYLSEAAQAEWLAAQKDEHAMAGFGDDDEDGDTDSLMEWWYTVEQWDELPSDDENQVAKDESKSFSILADKVERGLRVFNKVFTERAEVLWLSIITLHSIADDISEYHEKAKKVVISGGTTSAVGGATAIAGLALAPFTFGASLLITAIGVGVATAGGITSASAAISDNVHSTNDRKKVEVVLQDYEGYLLEISRILHFVDHGVYKLRGHPFLRSGTQHYSEDWEVRKAVQIITLVDTPVMRATEITDKAITSVQRLFKGIDQYFIKESRELKKGCRKEIVGDIKHVASLLNDVLVELNVIREELQAYTGNV